MSTFKNSSIAEPLVSVIIPVFNAERYIVETITSTLNQTWKNIEILLIDDGSTDASYSIIKSFESETVKVFQQQNRGASAARNKGIKEAKGDYIQFLDADDLLEENKIEQQLKAINFSLNQLVLCPETHFPDGKFYKNFSPEFGKMNFHESNPNPLNFLLKLYGAENDCGGMIALHAWLSPKALINKAGFWNESLTVDDDGEYFCRVVLTAEKIICTDETTCYYRKYADKSSLSGRLNDKGLESMLHAVDLKQQHLAAKHNLNLVKQIFASHYWSIALTAYPRFKKLSAIAVAQAKEGNYSGKKYFGGPISSIMAKFLGWKIVSYINYFRYDF